MTDPQDRSSFPQAGARRRLTGAELAAAGLGLLWLLGTGGYFVMSGAASGVMGLAMALVVALLPVALIWVTVTTLRSVQDLRAEAVRLQAAIEAMRTTYANPPVQPAFERKLEEIERAARSAETAVASMAARRDPPPAPAARKAAPAARPPAEDQPALALGTPAEDLQAPLSVADFIKAMQFPESPDDKDGFRALRLALEDRKMARLIRAAQDVLTLLAQEGIYMDDLKPDRARPELWRVFAQGERGRAVSGLGGIRDRSSLALTAGRMREDPVFRDAAHHFLRTFDRTFQEFEKTASDAELVDLADTRSARAFMLIGRVAGVFD